ncbi:DUF2721 domain-containing protein [Halovulum sp. GXIMD14794]
MALEPDTLDQISQAISHAIAPAFLLGAMSAFVSFLSARIDVVLNRIRGINAISEGEDHADLKTDVTRLTRRLLLLRRALLFTIAAGLVTTVLMIMSFALAVLGIQHVWGVAMLFIVALALYAVAIFNVGLDGMISIGKSDHF